MDKVKKKKILVVDDEDKISRIVSRFLEKKGFDTCCAADGCEAMEILQRYEPDLMVLDIMMPRMDGYAVLTEIRKNPVTTALPVIILSALGIDEQDLEIRGLRADGIIRKPFSFSNLIAHINQLLED